MSAGPESQLELFDLERPSAPRPLHRELLGQLRLQLRYDQLVLGGIAGLIGMTVIFACGVERGKQLARVEGAPLSTPPAAMVVVPRAMDEPSPSVSPTKAGEQHAPVSSPAPKAKTPSKPAVVTSRYAVQLATYSRPQLAKQELERLKARGEPAFLVMRDGRTSVYVGPFPSKQNASKKVARLKTQYQDCFVKNL